jgi:peptidyl-prolyl cis-trans isomerase B (cyclophilin B)
VANNRKQTKRERKQAKQAAREAARRAERRRTIFTAAIVGVVVLIGAGLIALTLVDEREAAAEAEREAAAAASEAARQASEEAEQLANREVACGGQVPEAADEDRQTYDEPDDVLTEGVDYRAVIETSCGRVELDLAEGRAPEAVNSFVFLARQGFFDGLEIFRNATTIGALQTGSGTNDATWQIGYALPDELEFAQEEGYPPGAVAMANSGPDTAGSQFFFVYNDSFGLEPTFTRFATVTEGLDVLQRIGEIPTIGPRGESPSELVYMNSVEIVEADPDETSSPAPTGPSSEGDGSASRDASEQEQ